MSRRELHLGMFLFAYGHHRAAWRLPNAPVLGPYDIKAMHRDAQALERAKFDFLFMGDTYYSNPMSTASTVARLEPFTWISNVAAVTEKIGLVATISTTFHHPFHVARFAATLDYLSAGRAGLNVVTSIDPWAMRNFGHDDPIDASERWDRANEFIEVVRRLWDSIEDGALIRDRQGGTFADWNRIHTFNHRGRHFKVQGPLNCARPPQGYPVQVQAGTSEFAHEFTAKYTDVFFAGVSDLIEARAYYAQLKARLARHGRARADLKVLPAVAPYVAESRKEAKAIYDHLNRLLGDVDLTSLSQLLEIDLKEHKIDGPLPLHLVKQHVKDKRMAGPLLRRARAEGLTVRELAFAHQASVFGHFLVFGSAREVADTLQEWFENEAADGYNICPPYLPDALDAFLGDVVPELQRRGIFRANYTGATFREHLGLSRPDNQFRHAPPRPQADADSLQQAAAG